MHRRATHKVLVVTQSGESDFGALRAEPYHPFRTAAMNAPASKG